MGFKKDSACIIEKSLFLQEYGYEMSKPDDDSVNFTTSHIRISVTYDKLDDISNISLFFIDERELFNIGWIAFIRDGIKLNPRDKLNNLIKLLDYMKKNYTKIIDLPYCLESRKMIKEYIESHQ